MRKLQYQRFKNHKLFINCKFNDCNINWNFNLNCLHKLKKNQNTMNCSEKVKLFKVNLLK